MTQKRLKKWIKNVEMTAGCAAMVTVAGVFCTYGGRNQFTGIGHVYGFFGAYGLVTAGSLLAVDCVLRMAHNKRTRKERKAFLKNVLINTLGGIAITASVIGMLAMAGDQKTYYKEAEGNGPIHYERVNDK